MSDAPTLATTATAPSAAPPAAGNSPAAPAQRVTADSPEWASLTTEQRHSALRGPENPRARGYSPAVEQREAAAARAAGEAPQDQAAAADPAAPAAASTEKLKVGKYEVSESDLAAMMDRQAQDDLRKATVPPSADGYKVELPADLKLPGDGEYKLDASNPGIAAARNWAHAKGLSQSDFSEMLGLYASQEAQQQAALAERSRQEITKAGVNAPQRVDAVGKWITGLVGEADSRPIRATLVTDAHLRFFERIMNQISSQGSASFSAAHRVPADAGKIPGYETMSFEQRRAAQDSNAARRGR